MGGEERNNTQASVHGPQMTTEPPEQTVPKDTMATTKQETIEGEPAPEAPAEVALEERIAALEAELAKAQGQVEEYLDQWRRTAAEFANYRKRQEREQAEFIRQANAALIIKLLPVLDDFALAFEHIPEEEANHSWVEGFTLIYRKLQAILEQEGVTPIETVGQPFDPTLHEAVTHEESDEVASGHIIAEVRKGYRLGDRVLRPAMVRVAR
ncbi:MAG: nucleotide exchange factor GrpE [Anaerolineae bacterium]|nr:nucleotide exchange factor GrpE [Anaerolineae bacterium]MDW8100317.1 nucleotide exchange factor GrpE [Anaerolineae bacterium]